MIRVRPMTPDDVADIKIQPAQMRDWPDNETERRFMAHGLSSQGRAFAIVSDDGVLLALAGVLENHKAHGTCWSILTVDAARQMTGVTRIVRRYVANVHYARLDMKVRAEFHQGHKWAEMLGFEAESVLRCWAPDGGDMIEYVRIKEHQS